MQIEEIPDGAVVVGADGSPSSELAVVWAADQARAEGRPLTIVHGVGPVGATWMDENGRETMIGREGSLTPAQELLSRAREVASSHAPDLRVEVMLRVADPRDVLVEASRRASVVVVGSRGRGPVRSLLLGSVGVAVTRHAHSPVVVLRPGEPGMVRHGVMVGVDGTERSRRPLEFAYRMASQRSLPLTVVHAVRDRAVIPVPVPVPVPARLPDAVPEREEAELLVSEALSGMREQHPDVHVTSYLGHGLPDDCLVRMGHRMDLLVVGSHHGGLATSIMFGSVAASVVEHATCPVAVVPTGDER